MRKPKTKERKKQNHEFRDRPFKKSTLTWVIDLIVKGKTIKFPEDNIIENPGNPGFGKEFLDM